MGKIKVCGGTAITIIRGNKYIFLKDKSNFFKR